jgi:hypothetical protein
MSTSIPIREAALPGEVPLVRTFEKVRLSIVAFASRLVKRDQPQFPEIVGTGFVVDARGIVVTNKHVIDSLRQLPVYPKTGQPAAFAIVPTPIESSPGRHETGTLFVSIKGYHLLESFTATEPYYGESPPDFGFVQLEVRDLPILELAVEPYSIRVGQPVATAGFPLGTDALLFYEKITQVMPFLRQGIISSVLPFPCPHPHGFTVDIMAQGGASGSPIFLQDQSRAVGVLHAGFKGTNITYAVPSSVVAQGLSACLTSNPLDLSDVPTMQELISRSEQNDVLTWETFRIPKS